MDVTVLIFGKKQQPKDIQKLPIDCSIIQETMCTGGKARNRDTSYKNTFETFSITKGKTVRLVKQNKRLHKDFTETIWRFGYYKGTKSGRKCK